MKTKLILTGLITAIIVTSGCLNTLDDNSPEENTMPEDIQENQTETSPETSEQQEIDRTIELTGRLDNTYNTHEIDVEEGETIEFIYQHRGGQHDLVLEKNGERVAGTEVLSTMGDSDSFTYTFEEEADYQFYCSVGTHRAQGMEGQININ